MKLIFHGRLAEAIGREIEFDLPDSITVADLRSRLDQHFPGKGLADNRIRACVSGIIAADNTSLSSDEPVEILAPVSGG